ncbi:MAG: LutB/LldF family L-lactate oxidation iron-sulfur protein [Myxococcota bacterium]
MEVHANRFPAAARKALADRQLQAALGSATDRLSSQRQEAFAEFPEGEGLRDRAREIKLRTLAQLDRHLEQLCDELEARGVRVHFAADAAQARERVVELVRARGGRVAVKSKSMTSEEIGLNAALEAAGIEAVETDLGEYIIQIAKDRPSHLIVPAIHKTRGEIADLFQARHGSPRRESHEELTRDAREQLRRRFLEADVGITGVNFAVASTGSLVLVENEGNIRLSTSLPGCHIAIMGLEKVIPDLESLSVFLRVLARSATGQKMSSYVSLLTGPRREAEADGPEELHLILLDNGRTRLLADPVLREALACIRCGACLNVCPVYRHAGGHAYGWVYPGPIGAIINPTLLGPERAAPLPFASTLCGACRESCPVRIEFPRLLLAQRANVRRALWRPRAAGASSWLEAVGVRVFTWVARSPRRYRWFGRTARWVGRSIVGRGRIRWLPGLSAWSRSRDFPVPARESFAERWARQRD